MKRWHWRVTDMEYPCKSTNFCPENLGWFIQPALNLLALCLARPRLLSGKKGRDHGVTEYAGVVKAPFDLLIAHLLDRTLDVIRCVTDLGAASQSRLVAVAD